MPAPRKKPIPPERMVELLTAAKIDLLATKGYLTVGDFERAWDAAWTQMVSERAWPHATVHRRGWRDAMVACKPEMRACFLDRPTAFQMFAAALLAEPEPAEHHDASAGLLVA